MGHYDDCYASEDYHSMTQKQKKSYFARFEKEIEKYGETHATYDDVGGYLLQEWARSNGYDIKGDSKGIIVESKDKLLELAKKIIKDTTTH